MLQDVRRGSLFTLRERRQNRILFLAPESITKLDIVLVLEFARSQARLAQVAFPLAPETGNSLASGVKGMSGGIEVVLEFKNQVEWKLLQACLDLVLEKVVGVEVSREEFGQFGGGIRVHSVGEAV